MVYLSIVIYVSIIQKRLNLHPGMIGSLQVQQQAWSVITCQTSAVSTAEIELNHNL